jgi:hypothetical protein
MQKVSDSMAHEEVVALPVTTSSQLTVGLQTIAIILLLILHVFLRCCECNKQSVTLGLETVVIFLRHRLLLPRHLSLAFMA